MNQIHTIQEYLRHFNRNERKKSIFSEFWMLEFSCFKKSQFFKSTNSQHFFTKISENGPWVSRRNSCIGQGCSSTYMVVRLSNKRAKTTKNAFLPLKWPFVGQPDNHIGWATSLAYTWISPTYPRTISWNFGEKIFRIGEFEKLTFFWNKSAEFHPTLLF